MGILIERELYGFLGELFAKRPDISIVDPCAWFGESFTPLGWALKCGAAFLEPYMIGIFWREGLSIAHISSAIRLSGCEHCDEYEKEIEKCTAKEDAIFAMVWCCAQMNNTQWSDTSGITAERMRRDYFVKMEIIQVGELGVCHVGNMDTK